MEPELADAIVWIVLADEMRGRCVQPLSLVDPRQLLKELPRGRIQHLDCHAGTLATIHPSRNVDPGPDRGICAETV